MKKKALPIILVIFLLLSFYVECFAVEISDFQGKWVAKYLVQYGTRIPVEEVPVDVILEIDGRIVSITSQAMGADHDEEIFTYVDNRLEMNGGDVYYTIYLQEDGSLCMNTSAQGENLISYSKEKATLPIRHRTMRGLL